jgi:hypothetical protein
MCLHGTDIVFILTTSTVVSCELLEMELILRDQADEGRDGGGKACKAVATAGA